MGRPAELQLPRRAGWPPWAVAASVAIHLAALAVLVLMLTPARPRGGSHLLVSLLPPSSPAARTRITMPVSGEGGGSPPGAALPPSPAQAAPAAAPPGALPAVTGAVPSDSAVPWLPSGCTVGKILGISQAMKSGIGSAAIKIGRGLVVGAIAAVNVFGDVVIRRTGKSSLERGPTKKGRSRSAAQGHSRTPCKS